MQRGASQFNHTAIHSAALFRAGPPLHGNYRHYPFAAARAAFWRFLRARKCWRRFMRTSRCLLLLLAMLAFLLGSVNSYLRATNLRENHRQASAFCARAHCLGYARQPPGLWGNTTLRFLLCRCAFLRIICAGFPRGLVHRGDLKRCAGFKKQKPALSINDCNLALKAGNHRDRIFSSAITRMVELERMFMNVWVILSAQHAGLLGCCG